MSLRTVRLRIPEGAESPALGEHPVVRTLMVGKSRTTERNESYFDTPDLALRQRGIILQARRSGGKWLGCVRFSDETGERSREWACGASDAPPEWSGLKRELPEALVAGIKIKAVEFLFEIECLEESWRLDFPDGSRMAILDWHGVMRCGTIRRPFHEVVLESLAGSPNRFFQTASAVARYCSATLEPLEPYMRGFVRRDAAWLVVPDWQGAGCRPGDVAIELFSRSGDTLLQWMQELAGVLMYGSDAVFGEATARLAAGVERLRLLLGLFQSFLPDKLRQEMEGELVWLAGELAPVGAWHGVLHHTLGPMVARFPEYPLLAMAGDRAETNRQQAVRQVLMAVDSVRFTQLLLGFASCLVDAETVRSTLAESDPLQVARLSESVDGVMRERLRRLHKALGDQGGRNDGNALVDEERLLALFQGVNQVLVVTTLFAAWMTDKKRSRYREVVEGLGEALRSMVALLNDSRLWGRLVVEPEPATHALFKGWQGARMEQGLDRVQRAWQAFLACPSPWG